MVVLEHFPKEDLRKFLVQMGRRYALAIIVKATKMWIWVKIKFIIAK